MHEEPIDILEQRNTLVDLLAEVLALAELNVDDLSGASAEVVARAGCYLADEFQR